MTTVFSAALATNDSGNENNSFRDRITTTGASLGQVRVRFVASTAATFQVDHASIGVAVVSPAAPAAGGSDTQATPVELKFSGISGFTITAGNTLTSDWVVLAFNSGDDLVVIMDIHSTNGNERALTSGGHLYYQGGAGGATYADSHPTSGTWATQGEVLAWVAGFDLIESQSSDGLMGQAIF